MEPYPSGNVSQMNASFSKLLWLWCSYHNSRKGANMLSETPWENRKLQLYSAETGESQPQETEHGRYRQQCWANSLNPPLVVVYQALPKTHNPSLTMRKTSNKPQFWGTVYKTPNQYPSKPSRTKEKNYEDCQTQEKAESCPSLGESKEMQGQKNYLVRTTEMRGKKVNLSS